MPPLWNLLSAILKLEKRSKFLPLDVAKLVIRLIVMRRQIFENAREMNDADYFAWPDPSLEHESQHYPNWPIRIFPKKYNLRNKKDSDLCEKRFGYKSDFGFGVFSVGCCCSLNITCGYEIMLNAESPRNAFRLLKCRDLDMNGSLKGAIFDFGCGLHDYILGREAKEFEYLRVLVDVSHYRGHKKIKSGKGKENTGGHLGCSSGYDSGNYKEYLGKHFQTTGREQIHSPLNKLCSSLQQMKFTTYMKFLEVYFVYRNLKSMGEI